jgi:hypothetical protein
MQPQLSLADEFGRIFRAFTVLYQMAGRLVGDGFSAGVFLDNFVPKFPKKA